MYLLGVDVRCMCTCLVSMCAWRADCVRCRAWYVRCMCTCLVWMLGACVPAWCGCEVHVYLLGVDVCLACGLRLVQSVVCEVQRLGLHGHAQVQRPGAQHVVREGARAVQPRLPRQARVRLTRVQDELWSNAAQIN